jgi:hypothetical protein
MNISHQKAHRPGMPLLALGLGFALLAGCHDNDEDTSDMPPPAATTLPDSMPAEPSTMATPMTASTANAYDADGTSGSAAPPSSVAMPPPIEDGQQPTQDGDASSGNPAAPPDDGG